MIPISYHYHLNKRLQHYDLERAHLGYRNRGTRPIDTVLKFAKKGRGKVSAKKSS